MTCSDPWEIMFVENTIEYVLTPLFNNYVMFTEPFSCAFINRYGFRYCLFVGSILSVTWITALFVLFIGTELPSKQLHFVLVAVVGGKSRNNMLR